MDKLQLFCNKTRYFWSLFRLILIIIFPIALISFIENFDELYIIIFLTIIVGLYIVTLIYIQISGPINSSEKLFFYSKIFSSIFSILFSIFMIYNLIFIENFKDLASRLISILLFLFGIYELATNENPNKVDDFEEINQIGQEH